MEEAEKKGERGLFITFEGIDGSGKGSQVQRFVKYLFGLDKYNHVIMTRNPYKDSQIRKMLRADEDPFAKARLMAEVFVEDRRKHVNEIVIPNLEKGHFVVSDRYRLSTITYQHAQGLPMEELIEMQKDLPVPDITFVIDVPAEVGKQRMQNDDIRDPEHKFEADMQFQDMVRQNFYKAKEMLNEKIIIINGNQDKESVFRDVVKAFEKEILNKDKKKIRYNNLDDVPEHIKKKLEKYFTNVGGDNFVIQNLPSELTGGALARYSRSATGMQLTIINEFLDENGDPCQEKGSALMDRVLNAFGDESVGELEGAHIGIENATMILIKTIEDRRIGGSPIEQSTRYVKYDIKDKNGNWRYLRPKEIMNSPVAQKYVQVCDKAFEVYSELVVRLQDYFKQQLPENEFEIEVEREGEKRKVKKHELIGEAEEKAFKNAYAFTIRCAALDVGRCILPSSTLSQLGIFGNGRFYTNLISTLKSSEVEEEKERGFAIEKELSKTIPTFVKRNRDINTMREREQKMRGIVNNLFQNLAPKADDVTLVDRAEHIDELVAATLFPYTNLSLQQILDEVKKMSYQQKTDIFKNYTGNRESRRDRTGRGVESGYPITFDLVGCFAEYRDLERHRMVTQQRQLLSTGLGFVMPSEVIEVGFENNVMEVVNAMEELNKELRNIGLIVPSQYATLFNHRMRFMMGMNLREFQHLSELRTQPAGHFSYRAMAMEMTRQLEQRDPWSKMTHEFIDYSDPNNKISRAKEQSRIAGGNIKKGIEEVDFV